MSFKQIYVESGIGQSLSGENGFHLARKRSMSIDTILKHQHSALTMIPFSSILQRARCYEMVPLFSQVRQSFWLERKGFVHYGFQPKGLSYLGKQWNHFIAAKIIPSGNISEVNNERTLYPYAIMEDIKFDVGEAIETSIWMNSAGKHNLGHPSLIFELCKKAGVLFTALKERVVPPVEIIIKSDQPPKEQPVQGDHPTGEGLIQLKQQ